MIANNLFIKNPRYLIWILKGYVTSFTIAKGMMLRPLLMVTFAANYWTGGLNPVGYHIFNILFHFLCAVFLYLFLKFLKKDAPAGLIFLITLLFLAHPLNTEAVTYLSSRSDLMVTLFIGLAFLLYLKGKAVAAVLCYLCSLLTKETGLCLPLLALAYDFIFASSAADCRGPTAVSPGRDVLKSGKEKKWYFYAFLVLTTVLYLFYKKTFFAEPLSTPLRSYYSNILIQSAVTFFYLKLFFWPHPLILVHNFPEFNNILDPIAFLSFLGIVVLVILIFAARKEYPLFSFGLAWYLICLLPKFYARLNYTACEHHFYLPSLGIYIILLAVLQKLYVKYKRYFLYPAAGIIIICTLLVWLRNYEWSDEFRFWKLTALREPLSSNAHSQLGVEYIRRGFVDEAKGEFETALRLSDKLPSIINNKGNLAGIYRRKKDYTKAISLLNELTKIYPAPPRVYENMGIIYMEMGRESEALRAWVKELRNYPQSPGIYVMLGLYELDHKKNVDRAQKLFQEALRLEPDDYLGYYGLGRVEDNRGNIAQAVAYYTKSIFLAPYFFDAHYALGFVYSRMGDLRAIEEFKTAIKLDPSAGRVYNDLAVFYASLKEPDWLSANVYAQKAKLSGYSVSGEFLEIVDKNLKKQNLR
jgi:tetratricopeptide (TPR) repeat protein